MRHLASIQKIDNLIPIEGADAIELARVLGWQCVVKKDEFASGDYGVYFEVDSYLPLEERYEFLRKSSYRNNEYMGEGFRIKTMRMRGELSQGLILPLTSFDGLQQELGQDVTKLLNIRKWEIPEIEGKSSASKGSKPHGIPTTDETRIQSSPKFLEQLIGKPYYITTKMDGTSCTMYYMNGEFGVCSRTQNLVDEPESGYWSLARSLGIAKKLIKLGKNIAIQGEYCGAGIQKNRLKLMNPKYYIFDVVNLDNGKYFTLEELRELVEILSLDMVPIEEEGESFNYSLSELLEKAKGKYPSGLDKEGIVIRSKAPLDGHSIRVSFKVINNDFLLKEKD